MILLTSEQKKIAAEIAQRAMRILDLEGSRLVDSKDDSVVIRRAQVGDYLIHWDTKNGLYIRQMGSHPSIYDHYTEGTIRAYHHDKCLAALELFRQCTVLDDLADV